MTPELEVGCPHCFRPRHASCVDRGFGGTTRIVEPHEERRERLLYAWEAVS